MFLWFFGADKVVSGVPPNQEPYCVFFLHPLRSCPDLTPPVCSGGPQQCPRARYLPFSPRIFLLRLRLTYTRLSRTAPRFSPLVDDQASFPRKVKFTRLPNPCLHRNLDLNACNKFQSLTGPLERAYLPTGKLLCPPRSLICRLTVQLK